MRIKFLVVLSALLFPMYSHAEFVISKSVFVQLAKPHSDKFDENNFSYFPAGTKLIKDKKTHFYNGSNRHLVTSEDGIRAYITEGMFWDKGNIESLKNEGGDKWVFISRTKDVTAKISNEVKLVIRFSRGEKYPLLEENEDNFIIKVGDEKISGFGKDSILQISIPRKHANLVDLSRSLTRKDAARFKLSMIDGITGIKKPCNTKTAIASKHGGKLDAEVGFSLTKFFTELNLSGEVSVSTETSRLEEFSKTDNVSRSYYTRDFENGIFKITRFKSCGTGQDFRYIYTNRNIDEITISKNWATHLPKAKRTSQVFISCPEQYFNYFDELIEWNFSSEEIPFVISQTAKFKSLTSSNCIQPNK